MLTGRCTKSMLNVAFIERNDKILMCKLNDEARELFKVGDAEYTGVAAHMFQTEIPGEAMVRIVFEETGLTMQRYRQMNAIEFWYERTNGRRIHCFYCDKFKGKLIPEGQYGTYEWIPKDEIKNLKLWRADRMYFKKNVEEGMKFFYYQGRYTYDEEYVCASLFQSRDFLKREEWDV